MASLTSKRWFLSLRKLGSYQLQYCCVEWWVLVISQEVGNPSRTECCRGAVVSPRSQFYGFCNLNILLYPHCGRQKAGKYPFYEAVTCSLRPIWLCLLGHPQSTVQNCMSFWLLPGDPAHLPQPLTSPCLLRPMLRGPTATPPVLWHRPFEAYFSEVPEMFITEKLLCVCLSEDACGNIVDVLLILEKVWKAALTPGKGLLDWVALDYISVEQRAQHKDTS